MISLVVFMTSAQQWAVGLLLPAVITIGGNYGYSKFNEGSQNQWRESIDEKLKAANLPQMKTEIELQKLRDKAQSERINAIELLFSKSMDEQKEQWRLVFNELKSISISSGRQGEKITSMEKKIGAIEVEITELNKKVK